MLRKVKLKLKLHNGLLLAHFSSVQSYKDVPPLSINCNASKSQSRFLAEQQKEKKNLEKATSYNIIVKRERGRPPPL